MATHRRSIKISETGRNDLILMIHFLEIAKQGINMNLIAFRQPTHVYRSDSCPFGLGGYLDEDFLGDLNSQKNFVSEHPTIYSNTSYPSSHLGLTCWLAT